MRLVRWTVPQNLRPEVPDVEAAHGSGAHRTISPGRRPHPAVLAERDAADGREAPAQVRIFAVELDGAIEPADSRQRLAADSEVAAVEDGAGVERRMQKPVRRR